MSSLGNSRDSHLALFGLPTDKVTTITPNFVIAESWTARSQSRPAINLERSHRLNGIAGHYVFPSEPGMDAASIETCVKYWEAMHGLSMEVYTHYQRGRKKEHRATSSPIYFSGVDVETMKQVHDIDPKASYVDAFFDLFKDFYDQKNFAKEGLEYSRSLMMSDPAIALMFIIYIQDLAHKKKTALLERLEALNPDISKISFDRNDPGQVRDVLYGITTGIRPEDIKFFLGHINEYNEDYARLQKSVPVGTLVTPELRQFTPAEIARQQQQKEICRQLGITSLGWTPAPETLAIMAPQAQEYWARNTPAPSEVPSMTASYRALAQRGGQLVTSPSPNQERGGYSRT